MIFIFLYLAVATLVGGWTGWHILRKLDKFDWAYHKTGIWLALVLRTVFWPLMLLFKPAELLRPKFGFRAGMFGVDLAETTRQRAQLMNNPTPCSSKITYRTKDEDGQVDSALFYFSAGLVEAMAHKVIDETSDVEGLHGTAQWAALRDEAIDAPVGSYNPDWALMYKNDDLLYFVAETKDEAAARDLNLLRPIERLKITSGRKHFKVYEKVVFNVVPALKLLITG